MNEDEQLKPKPCWEISKIMETLFKDNPNSQIDRTHVYKFILQPDKKDLLKKIFSIDKNYVNVYMSSTYCISDYTIEEAHGYGKKNAVEIDLLAKNMWGGISASTDTQKSFSIAAVDFGNLKYILGHCNDKKHAFNTAIAIQKSKADSK